MFNCFFGMPRRRNFQFHSAINMNFQPVQPNRCNNRQYLQNNNEYYSDSSTTNEILLKISALGGIVLPEDTDKNTTYNIASINLDTSTYRNFTIHFNFSCNIATTNARMHLKFQLYKQEKNEVISIPVSSNSIYTRNEVSTETNSFSLIACDCDSMKCKCCNYGVRVEIMGFNTIGNIMITNPILIASIIENNNEIL